MTYVDWAIPLANLANLANARPTLFFRLPKIKIGKMGEGRDGHGRKLGELASLFSLLL